MIVGFFQMNPVILEVETNVDSACRALERITADLMVLPEFFHTGYAFESMEEVKRVAEPIPGYSTEKLQEIACDKDMIIVAGICERDKDTYYNSAVFICGDSIITYRKVHLFLDEKNFFTPGNEFLVVDSIGIMICFDYFFPESARSLMLKGARLIAHPSNLILPYCPDAMVLRSLENRVFSVTCNRVGDERGLTFIGQSQIIDSKGNILYRAGRAEEVVTREINLEDADSKYVTRRNHVLQDRNPHAYRIITEDVPFR
ncbi:MAG: acyltransferase [Theionarchaea archaeon]|nr:acyltransferase [Theionarchaea archaeon]